MDDNISAVLDRSDQVSASTKGVVDDQRDSVLVSNVCESTDVGDLNEHETSTSVSECECELGV